MRSEGESLRQGIYTSLVFRLNPHIRQVFAAAKCSYSWWIGLLNTAGSMESKQIACVALHWKSHFFPLRNNQPMQEFCREWPVCLYSRCMKSAHWMLFRLMFLYCSCWWLAHVSFQTSANCGYVLLHKIWIKTWSPQHYWNTLKYVAIGNAFHICRNLAGRATKIL